MLILVASHCDSNQALIIGNDEFNNTKNGKCEHNREDISINLDGIEFVIDTTHMKLVRDGLLYSKMKEDTLFNKYLSNFAEKYKLSRYVNREYSEDKIIVIEKYSISDSIACRKVEFLLDSLSNTIKYSEHPIAAYFFRKTAIYYLFGTPKLKTTIRAYADSYAEIVEKTEHFSK